MSTTARANNPPLTSWAGYNATNTNRMDRTSRKANQMNYYDAAGDVLADNLNQYLYDGEGRICAVESTATGGPSYIGYLYDAEGNRVAKGALTQFTCDLNPADSTYNGFQSTNDYVGAGPGAGVAK